MAAFKHVWGRKWSLQSKCQFQHRNKLEIVNCEVMYSDGVLSVGYFLFPGPVCCGVIKEMTLLYHTTASYQSAVAPAAAICGQSRAVIASAEQ